MEASLLMEKQEKNFDGEDRRRSPRIRGAIIEYSLDEDNPYKDPAFIKNISEVGVCIYQDKPVEKDTLVFLKIHLFGDSDPIETKGRVVRITKSKYLGYIELGVEFTDLSSSDSQKLSDFIHSNQD